MEVLAEALSSGSIYENRCTPCHHAWLVCLSDCLPTDNKQGSNSGKESIGHLSVTSQTLPHAASGSDKGLREPAHPPTTRDPVAQAPTTDKGGT